METILPEYVSLCRMVGGWTDWVQGPGGNISIKSGNQMIIKRSGALLGDTTATNGWVLCDIEQVKSEYNSMNETITHTVLQGNGTPSIETFLHCLPDRVIVHLHPAFLLGILCGTQKRIQEIGDFAVTWIPYAKPGIPLAKLLFDAYSQEVGMYMLENHGILLTGDSTQDIVDKMICIANHFKPPYLNHLPFTNVAWATKTFRSLQKTTQQDWILQPIGASTFHQCNIRPFTPDIAVFLTEESVLSDGEQIYCVGKTLQGCSILRELYLSHQYAVQMNASKYLSVEEVQVLRGWSKEKLRRAGP